MTPEFAEKFKFQKSKGQGEFGIKCLEAVFNKQSESGEFFIEFEDYVWEHKLIESFQSQGAGQVTTITFANNDGGDSAANALVRILQSQKKTPDVIRRGTCPPALLAKVKAKQAEAERQELLDSVEQKEKCDAAMKHSLEVQAVKLEGINNNMQSQAVKLESHGVKLESIENGVCNVIPDLQSKNADLEKEVKLQKSLRDTTEGKLGHKTRLINQQDAYITQLEEERKVLIEGKHAWGREKEVFIEDRHAWEQEKNAFLNRISILEEELETSRSFKMLIEKVGHTAEILSSTLAEERAAKRQRV